MFEIRSTRLERIDTGDYTPVEYDRFLVEIKRINRLTGDLRAVRKSLLRDVRGRECFSVLDIGAGSGEVLRTIANAARSSRADARLIGLDLNERSVRTLAAESRDSRSIAAIRGDAFSLPLADKSVDFAISSLFAHHFPDESLIAILREMGRVARESIYVIDLHRHPMAYLSYRLFCAAFRISPLVREDGSLSILRGFRPPELTRLAKEAGFGNFRVFRVMPFRLVLRIDPGSG